MKPVAWVRRHPDGALTNQFLEDDSIEPVRKESGAWVPLYREIDAEKLARVLKSVQGAWTLDDLYFTNFAKAIIAELQRSGE